MRPALGPTFRYRFPPIQEETLENGLLVLWVSDHEQPMLSVVLQTRCGRFCDPVGEEGTAELAAGLLQKGSAACGGDAFAHKFEQAGANLSAEAGDEHLALGVRMLSRAAEEIVPCFWDMMRDPALDAVEFGRLRKEMVNALKAEYSDPASLANRHFYAELCGRGHPAGRVHTERSVRKLTVEHVRRFCRANLAPQGAILVVAGDCDVDTMRSRWRSLFASWTAVPEEAPVIASPLEQLDATRIRIVDKPDLSQTTLVLGHGGVGELHPAKQAVMLANYVFGGGNFSSRLMMKVRSEFGQTYGIGSHHACNAQCGLFSIGTSTRHSHVANVLRTVLAEYRSFVDNGVTSEELDKARRFVLGNMAFELEGVGSVAEKLLWLRFYGRGNDYLEGLGTSLAELGVGDVRTAIRNHLASNNFVIVAVGRRTEIEPQLRQFGPVHIRGFRSDPSA